MKKLILCDFDGTISIEDTGYSLFTEFSSGDWEAIDRQFCEGKIGSKEAYAQIAEIFQGDESAIRRFIGQHSKIDPFFCSLYEACRRAGIGIKIVSDGLDFYIRTILEAHHLSDLPFYANEGHFSVGGRLTITFPYFNEACGRCGTCKKNLVQLHRKEYDSILYIGNGLSDRCGAQASDLIFAKDSLYSYCIEQDIPCRFFRDFGDIMKDLRKRIRGLVFDLDGTLLEAHEAIYLGMDEALRSFGKTSFPFRDLKKYLKADLQATLAPFFSPDETSRAVSIIRKKYEEVYLEKTHFLDGTKGVLESLYLEEVALAVASNKFGRFARGALTHLGAAGHFKSILGAGDGFRNKPFPDMIQASLEEMNLLPEDVVFVGDSIEDIEAGKQAGVDVYAVPTGLHSKMELSQEKPKMILRNLTDLIPLVRDSKHPIWNL